MCGLGYEIMIGVFAWKWRGSDILLYIHRPKNDLFA